MAKGAVAKAKVEDIIRNAFGKDFLGVDLSTKKIYVQAEEDGEMVNVAVALTCPKTPFATATTNANDGFPVGNYGTPDTFKPAEITQDELDNVRKMIKELGL